MRRTSTLALVAGTIWIALGLAPAHAHAALATPGSYLGPTALAAGPVLAGDRVAWAAQEAFAPDGESDSALTDLYSGRVA